MLMNKQLQVMMKGVMQLPNFLIKLCYRTFHWNIGGNGINW